MITLIQAVFISRLFLTVLPACTVMIHNADPDLQSTQKVTCYLALPPVHTCTIQTSLICSPLVERPTSSRPSVPLKAPEDPALQTGPPLQHDQHLDMINRSLYNWTLV